jgi:hypothetical protein
VDKLKKLVEGLTEGEMKTLRSIINGKISKRKITPEQQEAMQKGRKRRAV